MAYGKILMFLAMKNFRTMSSFIAEIENLPNCKKRKLCLDGNSYKHNLNYFKGVLLSYLCFCLIFFLLLIVHIKVTSKLNQSAGW